VGSTCATGGGGFGGAAAGFGADSNFGFVSGTAIFFSGTIFVSFSGAIGFVSGTFVFFSGTTVFVSGRAVFVSGTAVFVSPAFGLSTSGADVDVLVFALPPAAGFPVPVAGLFVSDLFSGISF
jgi:hypothetical protein